jgi:hypothetical protein
VVVEDPEREPVCNRSGDRQLPNSGRAVEEHETRRCHTPKYAAEPR